MSVPHLLLGLTLSLLICLWATPAPAEEVTEAWHSPFETRLGASTLSEGQ